MYMILVLNSRMNVFQSGLFQKKTAKTCQRYIRIELFHRDANDFFTDCGLLRLDLRSDYETKEAVVEILGPMVESIYELFDCKMIGTKAIESAVERRKGLEELGFGLTEECLVGGDGTKYSGYYYRMK